MIHVTRTKVISDDFRQKSKTIKKSKVPQFNIGDIFITKYGPLEIIEIIQYKDVVVRFKYTGYVTHASMCNIRDDKLRDLLYPALYGVGYLGEESRELKKLYPEEYKRIKRHWEAMISRCYYKKDGHYKWYGGTGIVVSKRWHRLSNFLIDFMELEGYDKTLLFHGELTLDKDKFQQDVLPCNKIYSKDTCCLMSKTEQNKFKSQEGRISTFNVIHPDGTTTHETNISKFAREHNLSRRSISDCISGKSTSHKGYKFHN